MIKYTTLWDMMKSFEPVTLIEINGILGVISRAPHSNRPIDKRNQVALLKRFTEVEKEFRKLGLTMCAITTERMKYALSQDGVTYGEVNEIGNELTDRMTDEMESKMFFCIESNRQRLLTDNRLFGNEVAEKFPSAEFDISNASRCLAFELWTASVFHSMRVLEIGLSVLAKELGVPSA